MNLVTVLNRTLRLGYWGGSTLFHMAVCLLAGLLLLLFPEETLQFLVDSDVIGDRSNGAALMTPLVANTGARLIGFMLSVIGLLFGMFGSVVDHKARTRLNYFALATYLGFIVLNALHIYLRTGILRREVLLVSILTDLVGLCLVLMCFYYLAFDPAAPAKKASKNNKSS